MKELLQEDGIVASQAILVGLITRGRDEQECEIVQIDTLLASEVKSFFEDDTLDMPRRMIVRK